MNKLFQVLDSIVDLHDVFAAGEFPDADEIMAYAENGMGIDITEDQAERILAVGREWVSAVKNGGEWSMYQYDAIAALAGGDDEQETETNDPIILNLGGTTEVAAAIADATDRGLIPSLEDFKASDLRWWRDEDGRLYATETTIVEPGATQVELVWESGAGYFPA